MVDVFQCAELVSDIIALVAVLSWLQADASILVSKPFIQALS